MSFVPHRTVQYIVANPWLQDALRGPPFADVALALKIQIKKHTPSKGTREERVLISLFAKQLEGADQDQSRDVITITPCNDRLLSKGHSN